MRKSLTDSIDASIVERSVWKEKDMPINCTFFKFACPCGQIAQIVKVGVTEDCKIIVFWKCMKCREEVYCLKTIEEVFADAPEALTPEAAAPKLLEGPETPAKIKFTPSDHKLLDGWIKLEDYEEGISI